MCIRIASSDCECCAPIGVPPTIITRIVIGTGVRAPDM